MYMYSPIIQNGSNKFGNNRWKTHSLKMRRDVFLFSDLEYDNWLLTECNPNVISFCEQPFEIKIPYKFKLRKSIPDMWILYDNGEEEIVEVKYTSELCKLRVIEQIEIQQEWCKTNNIKHRVLTELHIRKSKVLLSNYKIIIKMLKNQSKIDSGLQTQLLNELKDSSYIKISEFSFNDVSTSMLLSTISYLIYHGKVNADLFNNHFGLNMEVCLKNGNRL